MILKLKIVNFTFTNHPPDINNIDIDKIVTP